MLELLYTESSIRRCWPTFMAWHQHLHDTHAS